MIKKKVTPYRVMSVVILVILALLFLFPLYWIITGAFKTTADIYAPKPQFFPQEFTWNNFERLFAKRTAPAWELTVPFSAQFSANHQPIVFSTGPTIPAAFRWLFNTVFMAVMAMVLTCITASMAGYALAKKRFRGRALLFSLIVCAMALPKQVILIPLIKEISAMNMWNDIWAVILPTVGWPFGVFLMKQFYEGVPSELCEAARIDGLTEYGIWFRIMLPLSKPALSTLTIFTFVSTWNDFLGPLIYLTKNELKTIQIGLRMFISQYSAEYGLIMAASVIALIPVLIVFLSLQKYFVQGVASTGIKG